MTAQKKKRIIITVIAVVLIWLIVWIVWGNTALELNTYTIASSRLPDAFDGYRIAHVSDLHNTEIGDHNEKLLAMLRQASPDMIVITGDLIDSRNTDIEIALEFAEAAMRIAPCYYVTGNHEARISEYDTLREGLIESGVTVLEDCSLDIEQSGETIILIGVDDPSFRTDYLFEDDTILMKDKLRALTWDKDTKNTKAAYTILLSHRPELFDVYSENSVDLVLSGHAHGGQFRLPFIGGLAAPNQGLFPKYDAGLYTEGNTNMLVSRGIGNSIFPFRFNNRPEVILIELGVSLLP